MIGLVAEAGHADADAGGHADAGAGVADVHAIAACRATLTAHSKSFALATRLLGRRDADRAAVIYTWCRRADDAVDDAVDDGPPSPAHALAQVSRLRAELEQLYSGRAVADPVLAAFAQVAHEAAIPVAYPQAMLDGMAADAAGTAYATLDELYGYGYQVAGTVGLMMSHVFGVRDDRALRSAVHLGIAMQLTNICRDVAEDWLRGRLYLPDELCWAAGARGLRGRLGEPLAALPRAAIARAVQRLLEIADRFYCSGDRGIWALPWRAGLAVRAARAVYARIGRRLARQGYDPLAGRVFVPGAHKVALVLGAFGRQLVQRPRLRAPRRPTTLLRFPEHVLPL